MYIGKSLCALNGVLEQYNDDNDIKTHSGIHHKPSEIKDSNMILRELLPASVLSGHTGRSHTSYSVAKYPHDKELLHF